MSNCDVLPSQCLLLRMKKLKGPLKTIVLPIYLSTNLNKKYLNFKKRFRLSLE